MYKKASFRTGGCSTSGISTRKQTESRPTPDQIRADIEKKRQKEKTAHAAEQVRQASVDAWIKKGIKLVKKEELKTQSTFVRKWASKRKKVTVKFDLAYCG